MKKSQSVIWFTGISGSGKTTLAQMLAEKIAESGIAYDLLDGDEVRDFFEGDLGYERHERIINAHRIAFTAKKLADNGILAIVANIASYFEIRDFIRRKIPKYFQIYCKASFDVVAERDVKGHYGRFKAGELTNLIGADDVYDIPRNPDIVVNTDTETPDESLKKIVSALQQSGII